MIGRRPLALGVLVAMTAFATGCFRDHPADAVQTIASSCASCHLHDFQLTTAPVHDGVFPRTCADCHRTTAWSPALEGLHPAAARFRIDRGAHEGMACLACHDPDRGASAMGANTVCAQCHTHRRSEVDGQHDEVGRYQWDPDDPSFCLRCHADGRGDD